MSTTNTSPWRIAMEPPPGDMIAPKGFPTDPRPSGAPEIFLDAMEVRIVVFCDEQKCALEPELDEDDPRSWHWVVYGKLNGSEVEEPLSVLRIVPFPHGPHPNGFEDPNEEPYLKLGRVATMKHARGKGLSKMLVKAAFSWLSEHADEVGPGWKGMVLAHAQVNVQKVYESMGFWADENLGRWDEEGIDHLGMWARVKLKA